MNKYVLLIISVAFILSITAIAQQIDIYSSGIVNIKGEITTEIDPSIAGLKGLLSTYLKLLTFQIPNFPILLNIIIFYPINVFVLYILLEILKDVIPFT